MRRMPRREWALVLGSGVLLGLHFIAGSSRSSSRPSRPRPCSSRRARCGSRCSACCGVGERPGRRALVAIAVGVLGRRPHRAGGPGGGRAAERGARERARARRGRARLGLPPRRARRAAAGRVPGLLRAGQRRRRADGARRGAATGTPLGLAPRTLALCAVMALGPGLIGHGSFAVALGTCPRRRSSLLSLAEPIARLGPGAGPIRRDAVGAGARRDGCRARLDRRGRARKGGVPRAARVTTGGRSEKRRPPAREVVDDDAAAVGRQDEARAGGGARQAGRERRKSRHARTIAADSPRARPRRAAPRRRRPARAAAERAAAGAASGRFLTSIASLLR